MAESMRALTYDRVQDPWTTTTGHRRSFGDMITSSLSAKGRHVRIIDHELLGEIGEAGPEAVRDFGYPPGDIVSAESRIVDDTRYQCRAGDRHVCGLDRVIGAFVRVGRRHGWIDD